MTSSTGAKITPAGYRRPVLVFGFVSFGGYPWIGETGAIAMKYPTRVWVDSCWLPTISYTMAKRAFHEWLDVMPSDRIMWGADCNHAEGIYGATEFTRRCLATCWPNASSAGN
jgi:predicted TIM-barrel fold metal-dependent hydrolase